MKIYTDLAVERTPEPQKVYRHPAGVRRFLQYDNSTRYVTVTADGGNLFDPAVQRSLCHALTHTWIEFLKPHKRILVIGLGNRNLTCDALGVHTAERIATGAFGSRSISSLCPGVFGITNIETSLTVRCVTAQISPDIVVVFDALCSRDGKRICSCFQFSTGGIAAGSGVGNHSQCIDERTLGVPCLAVGVPTVARAGSMLRTALAEAGKTHTAPPLPSVIFSSEICSMLVTPKEIDLSSDLCSRLLAQSFHEAILR